jgi:pimeloyl-ACP methyl ester carboxylesterase
MMHTMEASYHEPAPLRLPRPAQTTDITMSDGAVIRLRRYGQSGRVRLMLSHGNGLAINAYLPFWQPLIEEFELVLFDIRNHGENPRHDPPQHNWPRITQDIGEIFAGAEREFGAAATVGVLHSLSSVATLFSAIDGGPPWHALALFDPPIFPRKGHALEAAQIADMEDLTRRSLGRPQSYRSPEIFAAQLKKRRAFERWVAGEHLLFAQSTLRPESDGQWHLCCPRELEAFIFKTNIDPTLWPRLDRLRVPTILIGADADAADAGPPARICRAIHEEMGIEYAMIPDTTHFLQFERPRACIKALLSFLHRQGLYAQKPEGT